MLNTAKSYISSDFERFVGVILRIISTLRILRYIHISITFVSSPSYPNSVGYTEIVNILETVIFISYSQVQIEKRKNGI